MACAHPSGHTFTRTEQDKPLAAVLRGATSNAPAPRAQLLGFDSSEGLGEQGLCDAANAVVSGDFELVAFSVATGCWATRVRSVAFFVLHLDMVTWRS